ncbi:MAG: TonB-dependent receptor [Bacteroidales bacterium]|jgi:outer membrane receptor protein involved in Fe transport
MKRTITSFFWLFILQVVFSQAAPSEKNFRLVGKVVDRSTGSPLEFATISVYTADSVLVTGGLAGSDGTFAIDLKPGAYYAEIQFISYKKSSFPGIRLSEESKEFNLGTVSLSPDATYLDEVTVTAEKSEMVIHLDKKIFNVGKDLSNTGKSALEIMDNIPSVTVDLDGNISLRGSQGLQILVDGKPSGMVSAGNTDALRNIQGNMIERIEVITNPSARHEAEGMAGIINIVLKKEQQKGVNGSFEASAGYPHDYSLGANVNFRRKKINYFLNYNIRYSERPGGGHAYQEYTLPDTSYITRLSQNRLRKGLSNRINGGVDYFINPKNTVTGSFILGIDNQLNISDLTYNDSRFEDDVLLYRTDRQDKEKEDEFDIEFTLNYEKTFSNNEHKLNVFAHYLKNGETEDNDILESIEYIPENQIIREWDTIQRVLNEENERNFLIQADYIYPFGNTGKFETGYRSEFREINNPYIVEEKDMNNHWSTLPDYTNHIDYIENVHAAYVQAGNKFGRFSIQAGLRGELSDIRVVQNDTSNIPDSLLQEYGNKNEDVYFDLFPTVHTTYEFNASHALQISYSRRIHRPHFWLLNPFFSYTNPRNIRSGNPNLKPEYTNSYELGYLFRHKVINVYTGIYFRDTKGVIERISVVNDSTGVSVQKPYNLSKRESYGLEANIELNPAKWITLAGDINYYRSITNGIYEDEILHSDYYSWNTRLNAKLRFERLFDIQSVFRYRAPSESAQEGTRKAMYMLGIALSREILNKKGTVTFNIRDVLNSRKYRFTRDLPELYSDGEWRHSERTYTLTLVYRLNQKKRMGQKQRNGEDFGGDDIGF